MPTAAPLWPPSRSLSCWPTSASPRATTGPIAQMTTPTQRHSSAPSSTGLRSPPASVRSKMPTPSAVGSSPGHADHRHSGIGFHTPGDVHYGRAELVRERRGLVLEAAYSAHPERFVRKPPTPPALPTVAWIN